MSSAQQTTALIKAAALLPFEEGAYYPGNHLDSWVLGSLSSANRKLVEDYAGPVAANEIQHLPPPTPVVPTWRELKQSRAENRQIRSAVVAAERAIGIGKAKTQGKLGVPVILPIEGNPPSQGKNFVGKWPKTPKIVEYKPDHLFVNPVYTPPSESVDPALLISDVGTDMPRRKVGRGDEGNQRAGLMGRTAGPRSVDKSMEKSMMAKTLDEDRYLASFLNPNNPARGPGGYTRDPTFVCSFRGRQNILIYPHSATALDAPTGVELTLDSSNSTNLVVTPTLFVNGVQTTQNVISTGYSFSNLNREPGQAPLFRGATMAGSSGSTVQLFPFDVPWPTPWKVDQSGSLITFQQDIAHRTVGLRATLTVTTNAFQAAGTVFSGDNMDFYSVQPRVISVARSDLDPTEVQEFNEQMENQLLGQPVASGVQWSRLAECGAFSNGATYEAQWLPDSNKACQFREEKIAHQVTAVASGFNTDSFGTDLTDQPVIIFCLQNLNVPAGQYAQVELNVTWSVEMVAKRGSTVGFLYTGSLYGPSFTPDWNRLMCARPGGTTNGGSCLTATCDQGLITGMAANIAGAPESGLVPAALYMGAKNPLLGDNAVYNAGATAVGSRSGGRAGSRSKLTGILNSVIKAWGWAQKGYRIGRNAVPWLESSWEILRS